MVILNKTSSDFFNTAIVDVVSASKLLLREDILVYYSVSLYWLWGPWGSLTLTYLMMADRVTQCSLASFQQVLTRRRVSAAEVTTTQRLELGECGEPTYSGLMLHYLEFRMNWSRHIDVIDFLSSISMGTHTCLNAFTQTHTCTRTRTHMDTHTRTHTHTHTLAYTHTKFMD